MSNLAMVAVNPALSIPAANACIVPIYAGAITNQTGIGEAVAGYITLEALATFVGGGGGSFPLLAPDGDADAPSYAWENAADAGFYLVPDDDELYLQTTSAGTGTFLVSGSFSVGAVDNWGDLEVFPDASDSTINIGLHSPVGNHIAIGRSASHLGFFGASTVPRPEVPAIPIAQDIADALVALGLVTQAS